MQHHTYQWSFTIHASISAPERDWLLGMLEALGSIPSTAKNSINI
jgi:hypothetical protein